MKFFTKKLPQKTEVELIHKMSMYISAGLSLPESIALVQTEARQKKVAESLGGWKTGVENGKSLSQVFSESQTLKPSSTTISLVEIGEMAGKLDESLRSAGHTIKRRLELKKKIISAAIYPALVLFSACLLILGLMLFVFPKIVPLFLTFKVALPFSTRILIWLSEFLKSNGLFVLTTITVVLFGSVYIYRKFNYVSSFVQKSFIRLPFIGPMARGSIVSGIFESIYTLYANGEQLDKCLHYATKTTSFNEYTDVLTEAGDVVTAGKSLGIFLGEKEKLFPHFIPSLVLTGEKTGNLEVCFRDISEILRSDFEDKLKLSTSALEPILMVALGGVIGFIALSIILPIYSITSHFQNV